ncbi:MAG TPA: ATP-binding protein [Vicinamibacteria bacterium]|nr:ATP-binding protein [Vicinamibacteria bacterium]
MFRNRAILPRLADRARSKLGRLIVLTGARQTGKTTLVRRAFPEWPYVSLEDPVVRPTYSRMSAAELEERYPTVVLDEVQKAPSLVETVKAAYDAYPQTRFILLGSSQILLLAKVRESLAGRAAIEELWPLTLPEMATESWDDSCRESRLVRWLRNTNHFGIFDGVPGTSSQFASLQRRFETYLDYGAMPTVTDPELSRDDRIAWLNDYQRTYLERDVTDLASLRDLEPFVVAQRVIASRTGRLVNYSDLARSAGIAPATARRFLRYLELSYQVVKLSPFHRNVEKRLSKSPKVHFLDPGILRALLNHWGELTGEEYESAVVAEVYKQVRTARIATDAYHLRTYDDREVDLLLELEHGFVAFEIKKTRRIARADLRSFHELDEILDKPLLAGFALSQDRDVRFIEDRILALPVAWALGPPERGDVS